MGSRTVKERAQDEIMRAIMWRLEANTEAAEDLALCGVDASVNYPDPEVYKAQARRVMRFFGYSDWPGL